MLIVSLPPAPLVHCVCEIWFKFCCHSKATSRLLINKRLLEINGKNCSQSRIWTQVVKISLPRHYHLKVHTSAPSIDRRSLFPGWSSTICLSRWRTRSSSPSSPGSVRSFPEKSSGTSTPTTRTATDSSISQPPRMPPPPSANSKVSPRPLK